jgi:ferric-dicitrate binding protein FerR (iron transport regulator)
MQQQELIEKWLNGSLSEQETAVFEKTDEYRHLQKITEGLQAFKAPDFDVEHEYARIQQTKHQQPEGKVIAMSWLKPLLRIAAVLIVMAGTYFIFLSDRTTSVSTLASQQEEIKLPDESEVVLNAESSIAYTKSTWKEKREVELEGEAFFKVAKGSRFDVKTSAGIITVLGTQFNVKNRAEFFEVVCYEGLVQVTVGDNSTKLSPGSMVRMVKGEWITKSVVTASAPGWMLKESSFESVPYSEVLDEFERQYNVVITTKGVDERQLFTGRFVHTDMELALKAITIPLNLTYALSEGQKTVVLSGEVK